MEKVERIPYGDQQLPVREIAFDVVSEPWAEYKLLDGGRLRVRATVLKLYRVLDDSGQPRYQPDGQPFIVVTATTQVVASE